jgi:uncharacterized protein (TIGR03086 family)
MSDPYKTGAHPGAMLDYMNAIADRYRRLSENFTKLIESVPADAWDNQSPCEEWKAKDIVEHVVSTELDMLHRMPFAPDDVTDASKWDWAAVRQAIQSALDDPARRDHEYEGYFGKTTFGETVDRFYSMDLVLHAWDLARATGQEQFERIPDDEIATLDEAAHSFGDAARAPGVFGPEVTVPDDTDRQSKLLAFTGRRP